MKSFLWSFLLAVILSACAAVPVTSIAQDILPSNTGEVGTLPDSNLVVASAKILPQTVYELGFTFSALVKEIPVQEGQRVKAGDLLILLDTPELEFAAIAAEQEYASKRLAAELQNADKVKYVDPVSGKVSWYALPREVYEKALAKADQSKAAWDYAAANRLQNTLLAPIAGTVVDVSVIPGEIVQPGQGVVTLVDLGVLQVETTDLSERDVLRVQIGQKADVYVESLGQTFEGMVVQISPVSKTVGGDVVFPVTIKLIDQPPGLLWGMTAEVRIITKE